MLSQLSGLLCLIGLHLLTGSPVDSAESSASNPALSSYKFLLTPKAISDALTGALDGYCDDLDWPQDSPDEVLSEGARDFLVDTIMVNRRGMSAALAAFLTSNTSQYACDANSTGLHRFRSAWGQLQRNVSVAAARDVLAATQLLVTGDVKLRGPALEQLSVVYSQLNRCIRKMVGTALKRTISPDMPLNSSLTAASSFSSNTVVNKIANLRKAVSQWKKGLTNSTQRLAQGYAAFIAQARRHGEGVNSAEGGDHEEHHLQKLLGSSVRQFISHLIPEMTVIATHGCRAGWAVAFALQATLVKLRERVEEDASLLLNVESWLLHLTPQDVDGLMNDVTLWLYANETSIAATQPTSNTLQAFHDMVLLHLTESGGASNQVMDTISDTISDFWAALGSASDSGAWESMFQKALTQGFSENRLCRGNHHPGTKSQLGPQPTRAPQPNRALGPMRGPTQPTTKGRRALHETLQELIET